jgi:hypothetical protein
VVGLPLLISSVWLATIRELIGSVNTSGHNHQSARNDSMSGLGEHPWQGKIAQTKGSAISMTKDDIRLLYEYDRWANNRVLQAVSTLSVEQFTRGWQLPFRARHAGAHYRRRVGLAYNLEGTLP